MSLGVFRVDTSVPAVNFTSDNLTRRLLSDPTCVNFRVSPPEQSSHYGSFLADSSSSKYNMLWGSRRDFELFLAQEQSFHCMEMRKVQTARGLSGTYLSREYYVCARHGTGGTKSYAKKHDDWSQKILSKITHCTASLVIKSYPDKQYLLGIYDSEHNHPLGYQNIRFMRISPSTRDWIAGMVTMKVKTNHIVSNDVISISSHELTCISTS